VFERTRHKPLRSRPAFSSLPQSRRRVRSLSRAVLSYVQAFGVPRTRSHALASDQDSKRLGESMKSTKKRRSRLRLLHAEIAKRANVRPHEAVLLVVSNWFFQGSLEMDWSERLFKIATSIGAGLALTMGLASRLDALLATLIGFAIGHTLNWILNGQIPVLRKNLGMASHEPADLAAYVEKLAERGQKAEFIHALVVFGSFARREETATSDVDLRVVRTGGIIAAFRACLWAASERLLAAAHDVPIDMYVRDSVLTLRKGIRAGEPGVEQITRVRGTHNESAEANHQSTGVLFLYPGDPYAGAQGGGIRHATMLADYLGAVLSDVTFMGVKWSANRPGSRRIKSNFTFVSVAHGSVTWSAYFVVLVLKFLRSRPRAAIVTVFHPVFALLRPFFFPSTKMVLVLLGEPFLVSRGLLGRLERLLQPLLRILELSALRSATAILAAGEPVREHLSERFGGRGILDKVTVVRSAVDLSVFYPRDRIACREQFGLPLTRRIVLVAARLEPVKNVLLAIRMQQHANEKGLFHTLVVAGGGRERRRLESLVANEGIKWVTFLGRVEAHEMPLLVSAADVVVIPSVSEGSPVVLRESLACGVPVVSTAVGDAREILDEETGAVSPPTAAAMLEAVCRVLGRDRNRVSARCRELARGFSPEIAFANVGNLYTRILAQNNSILKGPPHIPSGGQNPAATQPRRSGP